MKEGRYLDAEGSHEIVLGKKLAERLHAKLNDRIALIGQALDGSIANELLHVVGLLDFGGGEFEEVIALTQLKTAQLTLSMGPRYHQRVIFDDKNPGAISGVKVTSWSEILPEVDISVRFLDSFGWLISFIICIVVSLGLANTIMITFFEREKEFQSLNILGASSSWIARTLILEISMLALIALGMGSFFGLVSTQVFHFIPINLSYFSGGKPIIIGGISLMPKIRMENYSSHHGRIFLLVLGFLSLALIYPLLRMIKRSSLLR